MDKKTHGQIINELSPGKFVNLGKVIPAGSLEARRVAGGVSFYWRVTIGGKTERTAIGYYDSSAAPRSVTPTRKGYSVQAAIQAAQALAQQHYDNKADGGYAGVVAARKKAKRIAVEAQQAEDVAKAAAAKHTLENLLNDYCDYLESLERTSHKDARSIFKLHVNAAWPKIAALPANQVTGEQFADMMRRLLENNKGRTSNKLRSYARSAYQVARASRSKASIPDKFKAYCVTHNPVADTEPDESQNRADKNPLSTAEMRQYWDDIKTMPDFKGAALRFDLLTGGQRLEQLVRLKTADIGDGEIMILDGKGRPGRPPRPHTLPLVTAAAAALTECKPSGEFALSTDGGQTHIAAETLSNWAVEAAVAIPGFKTKRIRSGVETMLAGAGVSQEIRGRLQSHGISGVQNRHYDGHEYMDEKRGALRILFKLLNAPTKTKAAKSRAA